MRKGIWIIVSCLMVLSLALAACAPAVTQTTSTTPTTGTTPTSTTTTSTTRTTSTTQTTSTPQTGEAPKYGGTLTWYLTAEPTNWDEIRTAATGLVADHLVNDELVQGDWTQGPAGTGVEDWRFTDPHPTSRSAAESIAESWDYPEPGHLIFHIRHGVHFGLDQNSAASKLVNGRELDANDVVYSYNRLVNSPYPACKLSKLGTYANVVSVWKLSAPDKWTVDFQVPTSVYYDFITFPDFCNIVPREVVEKYGNLDDWKNQVGTGPFFLTDYVPASALTFARNPNFWGKDPIGAGKGNQLPYLDKVRILVVPDVSTQKAALRVGNIDVSGGTDLTRDDAMDLQKTAPNLLWTKSPGALYMVWPRYNNPALPTLDLRVRQALYMAIDFNTIVKDLYGGDASLIGAPIRPYKALKAAYLGLDDPECPQAVKDLYTFNPDKAKQLLKDAGYPTGFKMKIVTDSRFVDNLAILKDYWAKVGVDVAIDAKATNVMSSLTNQANRYNIATYDYIWATKGNDAVYFKGALNNPMMDTSYDCLFDKTWDDMNQPMFKAVVDGDWAKVDATFKETQKYVLAQAFRIVFPTPNAYGFWWPYVKNYHGETSIGYDNTPNWMKYVWIDSNLKQQLVGKK